MKITIDVPEVKCARCSATAPIQPHMVYLLSQTPMRYRDLFSAVLKEPSTGTAKDDSGRSWLVLADDRPAGWVKGPNASELCAACGVLWVEAGKAFMVPPPPPVVVPDEPELEVKSETEEKAEKVQPKRLGPVRFPVVRPRRPAPRTNGTTSRPQR